MRKAISICLFTVILGICVFLCVIILRVQSREQSDSFESAETTQMTEEREKKELAESMKIQKSGRYLLLEKEGILTVYEQDGVAVLFETNISLQELDEKTQRMLEAGIWIRDEKELYDFLESYSS